MIYFSFFSSWSVFHLVEKINSISSISYKKNSMYYYNYKSQKQNLSSEYRVFRNHKVPISKIRYLVGRSKVKAVVLHR